VSKLNDCTGSQSSRAISKAFRRRGKREVSYVEPIALDGQIELDQVAMAAASVEECQTAEDAFLERLRARDMAAFDLFVNERSAEVYSLLYRLTEDAEEARDLTQETFLRAFKHIDSFRGDADLKTWLYRIAINQARNRWRWWKRRKKDSIISLDISDRDDDEPLSARISSNNERDPEQNLLARERETALLKALKTLKQDFREAVILRDIEGLSYEEIADTLEISVGTVKSRIARGRLELRKKLSSL
jgi:RNA polymerase sigma-70 factor (ECF subfamily)